MGGEIECDGSNNDGVPNNLKHEICSHSGHGHAAVLIT